MSSSENVLDLVPQGSEEPVNAPVSSAVVRPVQAAEPPKPVPENELRELLEHRVKYSVGQEWGTNLSDKNLHLALSLAVRDLMVDRMLETEKRYQKAGAKRLYYLSMEFLVGRSLGNNLCNLGIFDMASKIVTELGFDLEELREEEMDAALGNGGLGRLAACFLDSLASLDMPGFGYGINYEYGLFKQEIEDGQQKEKPDSWRTNTSPWLLERSDEQVLIPIFGRLIDGHDRFGNPRPTWVDAKRLVGLPSDMPIVGYGGRTVNYLRLYTARASNEFDMQKFNEGDYIQAVEERIKSESISKVLYPSDAIEAGRELRLIQEYFFVACAIRDIVRRYQKKHSGFEQFPAKVAIQLNDTHPALAVAELMRMLHDESNLPWAKAWEITQATLGYTNHTLMPEALEKWPANLLQRVLPRHLSIIQEINKRFLEQVSRRFPEDHGRIARMSIIEEGHGYQQVRMANLAIVGSHAVNGVAALHSELVKTHLVPDFYEFSPEKFSNKTNGVTQRRWVLKANPGLADILTRAVGTGWIRDLQQLRGLEPFAGDEEFQKEFMDVKRANKRRLAQTIKETTGVVVDPNSMFDVIAKRIHEYKRQLLMAMRVLHEYLAITEDRKEPLVARTYIFAGKAAPGYWAAKQIIRLVNDLAAIINADKRTRDQIKVVFVPDYRVSLAERIMPAADLSEQISTAGKEASGTGNMKFAMNGALTIGTLDGANIEILEEVGADNMFVFGLKADEIQRMRETNSYNPWDYYRRNDAIKRVMDVFNSDQLFTKEPGAYRWIFNNILHGGDPYFHLADFESYIATQDRASTEYKQPSVWTRKAILNVARMGKFSSDRTILEYANDIWQIQNY
ncbi:MAG: glycogen/starch/alpha-glucan phosphorylase [Candidatus Sumerlaeaceae bacterium]